MVETDFFVRRELQKELMLYAFAIKDLSFLDMILSNVESNQSGSSGSLDDISMAYVFIICYGRIFGNNRIIGKVNNRFMQEAELTREEKSMHKSILDLRNQSYAHNDPLSAGNILVNWNEGLNKIIATATYTFNDLKSHTNELKQLVIKIKSYFENQQDKVINQLYSRNAPNEAYVVNEDKSVNIGYRTDFYEHQQDVIKS
jgi:hypothetical protein